MPNDSSERFRLIPNDSEGYGKVPNDSEEFGKIPNGSEVFRTMRNASESRENHTLTVREVARLFEDAGVSRTERSITNWCRENKTGIARLDAFFDLNERKYFITPESVDAAIREELAREKNKPADSESEPNTNKTNHAEVGGDDLSALRHEIVDLKIANRVKDQLIEHFQTEREKFGEERQRYVDRLIDSSRRLGELETKLRQIEAPIDHPPAN